MGTKGQADLPVPKGYPRVKINRKSGGVAFLPLDHLSAPMPGWGYRYG